MALCFVSGLLKLGAGMGRDWGAVRRTREGRGRS